MNKDYCRELGRTTNSSYPTPPKKQDKLGSFNVSTSVVMSLNNSPRGMNAFVL